MSPEDCKVAAGFYIGDFENEIPTTIKILKAVVGAGQGYRPDEKSRTGLELARHIALEDPWLLQSALNGEMEPIPDQSDECALMNGADCAEHYRTVLPELLEKVKAMSVEDISREVDFFGWMKMPAVGLVSMAIRHSAHHRGQLSSYLRAMGGKVPGIYGPSADEPIEG